MIRCSVLAATAGLSRRMRRADVEQESAEDNNQFCAQREDNDKEYTVEWKHSPFWPNWILLTWTSSWWRGTSRLEMRRGNCHYQIDLSTGDPELKIYAKKKRNLRNVQFQEWGAWYSFRSLTDDNDKLWAFIHEAQCGKYLFSGSQRAGVGQSGGKLVQTGDELKILSEVVQNETEKQYRRLEAGSGNPRFMPKGQEDLRHDVWELYGVRFEATQSFEETLQKAKCITESRTLNMALFAASDAQDYLVFAKAEFAKAVQSARDDWPQDLVVDELSSFIFPSDLDIIFSEGILEAEEPENRRKFAGFYGKTPVEMAIKRELDDFARKLVGQGADLRGMLQRTYTPHPKGQVESDEDRARVVKFCVENLEHLRHKSTIRAEFDRAHVAILEHYGHEDAARKLKNLLTKNKE